MFSNKKPQTGSDTTTIIASGVTVRGDVHFEGNLHLEGHVEGSVNAEADNGSLFTLDTEGKVRGEVRVPGAVIDGEVEGDIHCSDRLELAPGARITGDVHYKVLEMAAGATVNGRMVHEDSDTLQLTHEGAAARGADAQEGFLSPGADEPDATPAAGV